MNLLAPEAIDLQMLTSIPVANLLSLPHATGVYIVLSTNDDVIYIGQAVSIRKRLQGHQYKKRFSAIPNGRIAWVLVPYVDLSSVETAMIDFFRPSLNKMKGGNTKPKTAAAEYYQTTLRVPPAVFAILRAEAEEIGRPINTHLARILERHCAKTAKKSDRAPARPTP